MGDRSRIQLLVTETYQFITGQPGQLSLAIPLLHNEYQPKGSDAVRLGSKGRYGSCVGGW